MTFLQEYESFKLELDGFYSSGTVNPAGMKAELDKIDSASPGRNPYRRKASIYELAASRCDVQVFRHCPFYYEIKAGRPGRAWGFDGIGCWMRTHHDNNDYATKCIDWKSVFVSTGLLNSGGIDIDLDHHTIGYDNVLKFGFNGIIRKCEQRLTKTNVQKEREFLEAVISGYRALITLSEKFAARAESLLTSEKDETIRRRLELVRDTAGRVPAEAPGSFYEALNTIIFIREAIGSLEGIAVSTFGMLDRMLEPFYKNDLLSGRLSKDDAADLLYAFLAITDVKFDVAGFNAAKNGRGADHIETSTTVIIGGCDKNGIPVYNEITEMILDAYTDLKLVNPKLNARISAAHPQAYFDRLGAFAAKGSNVLSIYNDDVIIPANVRSGKALEDCRLYAGGGCQENILQNCAVHSRACLWLNLCGVLAATLFPERFAKLSLPLENGANTTDFDSLYSAFLKNLRTIAGIIAAHRTANERDGWKINPCPLHSATLDDCIDKAMDWTEGGARYSDASLDCVGIGTLIDSLYALKTVVFEQKIKTLAEFLEVIQLNYEGQEKFRQYLLHRMPKYGQDDGTIRSFSGKIFKDTAKATSGFKNSRGGVYEASLFAFRFFVEFGCKTIATPDGRKAGQSLSPGMSPSILSLGEKCSVSQILSSLEPLELKDYPIVGILDLKLPCSCNPANERDGGVIASIISRFIASGGSGLQINAVNRETLKNALMEPESYSGLAVRISGYSAYFTKLPETVQQEIIERTVAE